MERSARAITLAVIVIAILAPAGSAVAGVYAPHDPNSRDNRSAQASAGSAVLDCSDVEVFVFGNSIDYAAGVGEQFIELAWPVQLERHFAKPNSRVTGLHVRNEATPGATTAIKSPWGDDTAFQITTHIPVVLDGFTPERLHSTLVIVAPSLVDLQVSGGDVAGAVGGIQAMVEQLEASGVGRWIVLPINPTAHRSIANWAAGSLNSQIDAVNERLEELNVTPPGYARSALLVEGAVDGDPRYYDDFVNRGFEQQLKPPDYLHIDPDGHLLLAERLVSVARPALLDLCTFVRS